MDGPFRNQVLSWIDAVQCMTRALGFVVARFAEDAEEESFRLSVAYPTAMLETFERWASGSAPSGVRPQEQLVRFSGFTEATGRAMSPLLETVLVYPPTFLPVAEQLGEKESIALYGLFYGAWATYLCHPVWEVVPDLSPPGWNSGG